jgi:hypothetical protein
MPYEILVHISASTTKEEDDRYRRETMAYRYFKSSRIIYLDERDGDASAAAFQHPRHHTLQHEQTLQIEKGPGETIGSISPDRTEPNFSVSNPHIGTQVILDTQLAIDAFDCQISTIANSFYDGEPLSWEELRPAKRPRTTESSKDRLSSGRGPVPASQSPSADKSLYYPDIPFSKLDPMSSQLPDSYGLSKSDESNSIRSPKKATNTNRASSFPTSPHRGGTNLSRTTSLSHDNNTVALLRGRQSKGSPACSSKPINNSPREVDTQAVECGRELSQNGTSKAVQRTLTSFSQRSFRAVDPVQTTSFTRNVGLTTSPSQDLGRNFSPLAKAQATHASPYENRIEVFRAPTVSFPVPAQDSPRPALVSNHLSNGQQSLEANAFETEPHPIRVNKRLNDHMVKEQVTNEAETHNERSDGLSEKMRMDGEKDNQSVGSQAPKLSLTYITNFSSMTNDIQTPIPDNLDVALQEHQPYESLGGPAVTEPKDKSLQSSVADWCITYQDASNLNCYKEVGFV